LFISSDPASSTTKTGRYDIAEILLKVALKHQKSNQIISSDKRDDIYGLGNAYPYGALEFTQYFSYIIATCLSSGGNRIGRYEQLVRNIFFHSVICLFGGV
jgi:hypothetical protein